MVIVRHHQQGDRNSLGSTPPSPARREEVALSIISAIVERFERIDSPPPDLCALSATLTHIPPHVLDDGVDRLISLGVLTRTDSTPPGLLLTHDPSRMTVGEFLDRLHRHPETTEGEPLTEFPLGSRTTIDREMVLKTLAELPSLRMSR